MDIRFLNVDLEIGSYENLQPIIDDFGENVSVLFYGENSDGLRSASFEIRTIPFVRDVDELILSFCDLIENLSADSKLIWEKCHSKKLDCGFQSGDFPRSYQTEIRSDTIERVAKIGASIVITIYPKPE